MVAAAGWAFFQNGKSENGFRLATFHGDPQVHVGELDRVGALEERLEGLDLAVRAAVPVARLVLSVERKLQLISLEFKVASRKISPRFQVGG